MEETSDGEMSLERDAFLVEIRRPKQILQNELAGSEFQSLGYTAIEKTRPLCAVLAHEIFRL